MIKWTFDEKSANEAVNYSPVPDGIYEAVISTAEEKTSASNNDMIAMRFDVRDENGDTHGVFHNLVFLPDKPNITNRNLRDIRDAFSIPSKYITVDGAYSNNWIGSKGKVELATEEYNGKTRNRVTRFVIEDANVPF